MYCESTTSLPSIAHHQTPWEPSNQLVKKYSACHYLCHYGLLQGVISRKQWHYLLFSQGFGDSEAGELLTKIPELAEVFSIVSKVGEGEYV